MADKENWQKRYQKEADAHERAQRAWQDERLLLHRLVTRTSLAAKGQNPDLDIMLDQVREVVRNGSTDLAKLEDLRKRLDQELIALDDPGAEDGTQRARIVDTVLALLDQLLDTIELPDVTRVELLAQRERVANQLDWRALQALLEEIHRLVTSTIKRLQDEFAGFLRLMELRLADVGRTLDAQGKGSTLRRTATVELEQHLQADLVALGETARKSTSIASLRATVTSHVTRIADGLAEFRETEMTRETVLSEQLLATQDRLNAMESQSQDIRRLLDEERVRATTDPLTQLPNRTVWEERLEFEEARWERYGHPVVIGVIDIDKFKRINDEYGHKVGDRVLQQVARTMRANLRRTDFIARFGGEEFVLLLTDTHPDIAMQVADGLRQRVADEEMGVDGKSIRVTVSIGLASLDQASKADKAFDLADRALYDAKASGRNCVKMAKA